MRKQSWLAAVLAIFLAGGIAYGAGKISAEMGKELFNDPNLGGSPNESSCNSCHAAGKGLEQVTTSKKLSRLINKCLVDRMEGTKMDGRIAAMRSLKKYILSLNDK